MSNYIIGNFKKRFSFEDRKKEASRVREKYPDRVPVIVEQTKRLFKEEVKLDKQKFLVPIDLTIGQFMFIIRKRCKVEPHKAIFLMFGNKIPPTSESIDKLYEQHKDEDGFIYATVHGENTFG